MRHGYRSPHLSLIHSLMRYPFGTVYMSLHNYFVSFILSPACGAIHRCMPLEPCALLCAHEQGFMLFHPLPQADYLLASIV